RYSYPATRYRHSFPTRRSSDLSSPRRKKLASKSWNGTRPRLARLLLLLALLALLALFAFLGFLLGLGALFALLFFLALLDDFGLDRKSTRLNSRHVWISYAVFC